ncbi:hypothetical protein TTRE_0000377101 [Trichuris trichiura]|uniref:Uncharacterized protein n=1 Tax=Trichuris trichiura TaxID=36087 RepID=A0A077Z6P4_TRITR|nr:hypothetical protein TTRE_0000377101 [Trichuris trichiura]
MLLLQWDVYALVEQDVFTDEALSRGRLDADSLATEFDAVHAHIPTERMSDDDQQKLQSPPVMNWPASDSIGGQSSKYDLSKKNKFESEPPDRDPTTPANAAEKNQRTYSIQPNLFGLLKALLIAWDHLMAHQQQAVLCLSLSAGLALLLVVVLGIVQSCRPESARCNDKNVQENHRKLLVSEDGPTDVDLLDRNAVSFIRFANLTPPRSAVGANGTHFLP